MESLVLARHGRQVRAALAACCGALPMAAHAITRTSGTPQDVGVSLATMSAPFGTAIAYESGMGVWRGQ